MKKYLQKRNVDIGVVSCSCCTIHNCADGSSLSLGLLLIETASYLISQEMTRCSENNGGCEDRCEESRTGQALCSCSNPGMRLSADMKSCAGKKQVEICKLKERILSVTLFFQLA